jgi:hypothetical protein
VKRKVLNECIKTLNDSEGTLLKLGTNVIKDLMCGKELTISIKDEEFEYYLGIPELYQEEYNEETDEYIDHIELAFKNFSKEQEDKAKELARIIAFGRSE